MWNRYLYVIGCMLALAACTKGSYDSPDVDDPSLLPQRNDYTREDHGTQEAALELSGVFDSEIGLIYYDAETRTVPQLYLTRGPKDIYIDTLASGAVTVHFERFNTALMPLQMTAKVKSLLTVTADTIYLHGTDGMVRTSDPGSEIGTPLPESDDAELMGKYARQTGALTLFIDPMLPVPVKLNASGKKK